MCACVRACVRVCVLFVCLFVCLLFKIKKFTEAYKNVHLCQRIKDELQSYKSQLITLLKVRAPKGRSDYNMM